jgi:hypothetical protein
MLKNQSYMGNHESNGLHHRNVYHTAVSSFCRAFFAASLLFSNGNGALFLYDLAGFGEIPIF